MKGAGVFSVFWLLLSLAFFVGSFFLTPLEEITVTSPAGYPIFISALSLVFSVLVLADTRRAEKKTEKQAGEEPAQKVFDPVVVHLMVLLVLYVAAIILIHFVPATLLFLAAALLYLRKGNLRDAVLISYISTFMILLIFKYMFSVIMP